MYEGTSRAQQTAVSNILNGSKRNFEEELHEEPSAKKAQVSTIEKENDDVPKFVPICIASVYGRESVDIVRSTNSK